MEDSGQYQPIASRLGQEVYAPFTYAPNHNQVLFFEYQSLGWLLGQIVIPPATMMS